MKKLNYMILLMWFVVTFVESAKVSSPKPSLKQFREDYVSVKKTCQEVGFVSYCNPKAGRTRNKVAFTAVLPGNFHTKSHPKTLSFNKIKINLGNSFNAKTHRFTAPVKGVYGFSWSIANNNGFVGHSDLVKNGNRYHATLCSTVGSNHVQCGNTAFIWLEKSDQVWVQTRSGNFYAIPPYTSFSGWKLN